MSVQAAYAGTFKSSEFLKWERSSQEFYIDANIGMAGLIAVQNDKAIQACVESWYLSDKSQTVELIIATIQKFPDYHPRGVILAMMEKKCGSFTFKK